MEYKYNGQKRTYGNKIPTQSLNIYSNYPS